MNPIDYQSGTGRNGGRIRGPGVQLVALVLAIGICTAINLFCIAVLYDAIFSSGPGLSSNATQILASWGSGILGVIGTVVGYNAGHTAGQQTTPAAAPSPDSDR